MIGCVRGSLTVEAAIILAVLLFLFAFTMESGIQMYTECRDTAIAIQGEAEMDIIEKFYFWQRIGSITENEDGLYQKADGELYGFGAGD